MRVKVFNELAVSTESLEVGSLDLSRIAAGQFVNSGHELDITTMLAAKQEVLDVRCRIAICHPSNVSFGAAVLRSAITEFEGAGYEVLVINLYLEGRDPVLTTEECRSYFPDTTRNIAGLRNHVEAVQRAESLVLIFPIWMYGPPAPSKGWLDPFLLPVAIFRTRHRRQCRAVDDRNDTGNIGITLVTIILDSRPVPQRDRTRSVASPLSHKRAANVQYGPQFGHPLATFSRSRAEGTGRGRPARVKSRCRFAG